MFDLLRLGFPFFSKNQVNRAGEYLRKGIFRRNEADDWYYAEPIDILQGWQALHVAKLEEMRQLLTERARTFDSDAMVASRLKSQASILQKLNRYPTLGLAQMQDIAAIRIVFETMEQVKQFCASCHRQGDEFKLVKIKDYIAQPLETGLIGYRGIVIVFKVDVTHFNKTISISFEVEVLTRLQHHWASAVEFVLSQRSLEKLPANWVSYFSLISSLFALQENLPVITKHQQYTEDELKIQLAKYQLTTMLGSFIGLFLQTPIISFQEGSHVLLVLEKNKSATEGYCFAGCPWNAPKIFSFVPSQHEMVFLLYQTFASHQDNMSGDMKTLLVATDKSEHLPKLFPNWCGNLNDFEKLTWELVNQEELIKSINRFQNRKDESNE
jgi:Uncharacterized protein conserved in bacteria